MSDIINVYVYMYIYMVVLLAGSQRLPLELILMIDTQESDAHKSWSRLYNTQANVHTTEYDINIDTVIHTYIHVRIS